MQRHVILPLEARILPAEGPRVTIAAAPLAIPAACATCAAFVATLRETCGNFAGDLRPRRGSYQL